MGMFQISRERMVREQLIARGITCENVLKAMRKVPRHLFVEEAFQNQAYEDHPLPIGFGQTISQPYIVGMMSQLLAGTVGMRVLEIGTGSGYQAAILHEMGYEVYSVERLQDLYSRTSALLMRLRYRSIRLKLADGTEGWADAGPYDRIIVTAGGPFVPPPLISQLANNGILIVPVGQEKKGQRLIKLQKKGDETVIDDLHEVSFVDLIGSHGW